MTTTGVDTMSQYPTNLKLLLCQLVYDSKPETSWNDIWEKFMSHPMVTQLHGSDHIDLAPQDLHGIVADVINSALSDNAGHLKQTTRRLRGGSAADTPTAANQTVAPSDAVEPQYYQKANERGHDILGKTCIYLYHRRMEEIRAQLATKKKEFALLVNEQT